MNIKIDNSNVEFEINRLINSFHIDEKIEIELFRNENNIITKINTKDKLTTLSQALQYGDKDTISYKKSLYKALKQVYPDIKHPWGILTGIRPVKIANDLIQKSLKYEEIKNILKDTYYISNEKIELMLEIAGRQQQYINEIENSYSIYISIPFCPSRCNYCSFFSCSLDKDAKLIDPYLDSLEKEIKSFFTNNKILDKKLLSIYIGGGTPSTLSIKQFKRLIKIIETYVPLDYLKEFTFEAGRPDTLDRSKLEAIKQSPVTRLSINPQSMNDITLKKIGRNHTVDDIINCFYLSRDIGFDNINMDLILGLEDETIEHIKNTMNQIELLKPDSLTVHTLALKKASSLMKDFENEYTKFNQSNVEEFMQQASNSARTMGMKPYYLYRQKNIKSNLENTGYALDDKISFYNIAIMEEKQTIIAFGSGSISKFIYKDENRIERVANIKDVRLYIDRIDSVAQKKNVEVEKWI